MMYPLIGAVLVLGLIFIGIIALTGGSVTGLIPNIRRRLFCRRKGHLHGAVSKAGADVYVADCKRCRMPLVKHGRDGDWVRRAT